MQQRPGPTGRGVLLSKPDIVDMPGQAAWNDEYCIDPDILAMAGIARRECLGSGGNAAQSKGVERECGFVAAGPGLYLYENDRPPTPGDNVDLADMCSHPAADDPPPFYLEPERGERFRSPSASFGLPSVHLSACARS